MFSPDFFEYLHLLQYCQQNKTIWNIVKVKMGILNSYLRIYACRYIKWRLESKGGYGHQSSIFINKSAGCAPPIESLPEIE